MIDRIAPAPVAPRQLLSPDTVAHAIGLHPESVRRAIRAGRIRAVHIGRNVRIPSDELDRILAGGLAA
jgi:excisionase family DNA binding protein